MPKFKVYGHAGLRFKLEKTKEHIAYWCARTGSEEERNELMPVFDFHTVVAVIIKGVGGYKEAIINYCNIQEKET